MCTAISFNGKNHYFGRNLDLYYNYNEQVTVTPRNFPLDFRLEGRPKTHYAIIGMATVEEGYPLYYDAMNEVGLAAVGLNFPKNAHYFKPQKGKINLAPFELIPWVLGNFKSVAQVEDAIRNLNVADINFNADFPNSPLHWMISDKFRSIVLEPRHDGLKIYENSIGVLTNNPPFDFHILNLQQYAHLKAENPQKTFSKKIKAEPFSLGMGGIGLPGDASSPSRFIRAAFVKENSVCKGDDISDIGQFFHILSSVEQQNGITKVGEMGFEYTLYSSCLDTNKGVYYYTTYYNRSITAVDMNRENLSGSNLICYDLLKDERIYFQN